MNHQRAFRTAAFVTVMRGERTPTAAAAARRGARERERKRGARAIGRASVE